MASLADRLLPTCHLRWLAGLLAVTILFVLLWTAGAQITFDLLLVVFIPAALGLGLGRPFRMYDLRKLLGHSADRGMLVSGYVGVVSFAGMLIVGFVIAALSVDVGSAILFVGGPAFARFCGIPTLTLAGAALAIHDPLAATLFATGAVVGLLASLRWPMPPFDARALDRADLLFRVEAVATFCLAGLSGLLVTILIGFFFAVPIFVFAAFIGLVLQIASRKA